MRALTPHASPLAATLAILACAGLTACGQPPVYRQQAYVFGTLVEISVYGEPEARARQAVDSVLGDFDRLHRRLHAWEPGELDDLNRAFAAGTKPVPVSADLMAMLEDARHYARQSGHLFNPAIGNLVRLWGFHADTFAPQRPDPAGIARLVAATPTLDDLDLENGRAASRNPAVRLDLGGYAKGYALDLAAARLRGLGIANALVNIGGNVMALGRHGDRPWRVGIQHPRQPGALASLELRDGEAIGTSGDYQRYFELDGKRYCHLIDPRTGWPAQGTQSLTVLARGAAAGVRSDVLSKPLFIAGAQAWRDQARHLGIAEALRVDADGSVQLTAAMQRRIAWEGPPPRVGILP